MTDRLLTDDARMGRALALAVRGAGAVSPNPMVGCVVTGPDGAVWGEGWHGRWGGPHAEVWAVRDAERRGYGAVLEDATVTVTLEPCSHHGKTPPCADLLAGLGVHRVEVAMEDPFAAVAGRGIARLRDAGIEVAVGTRAHEAARLVEAFTTHVATGRPMVTLKTAATLDGQVATATGDSRWVSGPEARALAHRLRAESDAVLVGAGTARADDPSLTVRDATLAPGQTHPLRVVLDRDGSLPPSLALFTTPGSSPGQAPDAPTLAVTGPNAAPAYGDRVPTWSVPVVDGHVDLGALLNRLGAGADLPGGRRPVQSLLVEAGPGLSAALLAQDLVDRVVWIVAPKLVGTGTPAVGDLGTLRMADALACVEGRWEVAGGDAVWRGYWRAVGA